MKLGILLLFASLTLMAERDTDATQGEFSGEGMVKSPADYITLSFSVHSECQPNPKDAQAATDDVTKKIDEYLQKLKKDDDRHFKILVDGGFSSPYSRWSTNRHNMSQVQGKGMVSVELCRNTFQKNTHITLKIGAREDFHRIFADLQDYVLRQFDQGTAFDDLENPRTYVTLGTPAPQITRSNRLKFERDALDLAVRDAKANFTAAIRSCEGHRWKVVKIVEGNGHTPYAARYQARPMNLAVNAPEAADAQAAPVRFDEIEITKSVNVTFSFEGALCYDEARNS